MHSHCLHTYTRIRSHSHAITHTQSHINTRTTTHTYTTSLYPHLPLWGTHTHRAHSIIQGTLVDSLNRFCSVDRAIEKVVRSYKSNISFVCDVVRQVVVFDSISDMVSMLRAMNADPHVKIMRIKNRMSSGFKLCNALHFTSHLITSFANAFIRQRFYAYWNAVSNYNLKLTCEFECLLVSLRLLRDMWLSWCFSQHVLRKWHYYPWVF